MDGDAEILRSVRRAFADRPRPEHFTNYRHCEECQEHDDLLRSRDPDTLRSEDVDNPGWDPLCFISSEGFAYYFPGLARLALSDSDPSRSWYPPQLLFHLTYQGERNRHIAGFTPEERRAVACLLSHLVATRPELADLWLCADELLWAIDLWSNPEADGQAVE